MTLIDRLAQLDYLQLALTEGVGSVLMERLLDRFGSASAVLSASPTELCDVAGVGVHLARNFRNPEFRERARQTLDFCDSSGIDVLQPSGSTFPRLLREIPEPPNVLFVRGGFRPEDALSIAIVGTRTCSQYGRQQAGRFTRFLSRCGLTVVSGLARGIDAAAHEAAMEVCGRTIAVLASGVSEVYPPQHDELAERIAVGGAVISEMPPGTKPKPGMFPRRNRLISGLCLATLVIEASEHSGALITARLAGEQGRDVFAMPGMVTSRNARGCHQLIRDGAILVQDPEEVVDALGPLVESVQVSPDRTIHNPREMQLDPREMQLDEQQQSILQAIHPEPTNIDSVIAATGLPVPRVLSTLSVLEMNRLIRRLPGNAVQRV